MPPRFRANLGPQVCATISKRAPMFQPIESAKCTSASAKLVRPKPRALSQKGSGVQLSNYKMHEFDALLTAGRTGSRGHRAVQSAIQKERGGVLPANWHVALQVKENVEIMECAHLGTPKRV